MNLAEAKELISIYDKNFRMIDCDFNLIDKRSQVLLYVQLIFNEKNFCKKQKLIKKIKAKNIYNDITLIKRDKKEILNIKINGFDHEFINLNSFKQFKINFRKNIGLCHSTVLKLAIMLNDPEAIVHTGLVDQPNCTQYLHSWLEINDKIIDTNLMLVTNKKIYRNLNITKTLSSIKCEYIIKDYNESLKNNKSKILNIKDNEYLLSHKHNMLQTIQKKEA